MTPQSPKSPKAEPQPTPTPTAAAPPLEWMAPSTRITFLLYGLLFALLLLSHKIFQTASPGEGMYIAAGLGVALGLILTLAGMTGQLSSLGAWPVILYLALLAWAVLSFAWSVYPYGGIQITGTWLQGYWMLCAGLLCWRMVCLWDHSERAVGKDAPPARFDLKPKAAAGLMVFGFFTILITLTSLKGLSQYYFEYDQRLAQADRLVGLFAPRVIEGMIHHFEEKRIGAWYGNANVFAYVLAMGLPFLLGLIFSRRSPIAQGAWGLALIPVLMALYLTKSRGGWLCAILAIALALNVIGPGRLKQGRRPMLFVAAAAILIGIILTLSTPNRTTPTAGAAAKTEVNIPQAQEEVGLWKRLTRVSTIRERGYYIATALRQLRDSPWTFLTGNGLGSYETLYFTTRMPGAGESAHAHNAPLQLLVEGGAPALTFMSLILLLTVCGAWKYRQRWDEEAGLPLTGMALAGVLVLTVSAFIDIAFYHSREFYITGCLLVGWLVGIRLETQAHPPEGFGVRGRWGRAVRAPWLGYSILTVWIAANALGAYFFMIQPMRAEFDAQLAVQRTAEGNWDEALAYYESAFARQGNNYKYVAAIADIHEHQGMNRDALDHRRLAMAINPFVPSLPRAQALTLLKLNKTDEALTMADRAVRLYPLSPLGYAVKAQVVFEQGDRAYAASLLSRADALAPTEETLYKRLLAIMESGGDPYAVKE